MAAESLRYLRIRLLSAVIAIFGSILVLLSLTTLIPGDPATVLLGSRATPAAVAQLNQEMKLDRPIHERFVMFVWDMAHGDLGTDIVTKRPVANAVMEALPNTLALALSAIALSLLIGIPLAAIGTAWRNGLADQVIAFLSIGFVSAPTFVVSVLLLLVFSVNLGWFPVLGAGQPGNFTDQIWHLVLPAICLALGWTGYTARILRSSLLEIMSEPYIRTMRAYGVATHTLILKYALRPASIPALAVLGMGVGEMLGGAVFIEYIFNRPGLGTLISSSIAIRNYPVVQGSVVVVVMLYVVVNLLVDLAYGWIDPRIRAAYADRRRKIAA